VRQFFKAMNSLYPWLDTVQATKMLFIGTTFGVKPEVINTHRSGGKSLPVVKYLLNIRGNNLEIVLRDNFYDVNMLVKSEVELNIPLEVLYPKKDFEWYLSEIKRKENYCYQHWTKDEVNDPRILRVKHPTGHWMEKRGDEKDRWLNRMESTEWYGCDWSSGKLIHRGNIPFDVNSEFFHAQKAYSEGINESAEPYTKPTKKFIYCGDWERVMKVIEHLTYSKIITNE
jgi:hypothetical protein